MERSESLIDLPGFRFHPTEEELLDFYLRQMVHGRKLNFDIIGTLNIYLHEPWELPGMAKIGEREWFFFVPRDRRSSNGGRPNRTTECGFWKATGSDRPIRRAAEPRRVLGVKKTLVFYRGRAPRGTKTDWVMNEYRMPESVTGAASDIPVKADIVLCKVYRKATSLKELEQRAKMEDEKASPAHISMATTENTSNSDQGNQLRSPLLPFHNLDAKEMKKEAAKDSEATSPSYSFLPLTSVVRPVTLPELQVAKTTDLEWMQDPFLTQLRSPWMDLWSPNFANILNY
ncbi:NAC domain-containing protein 22-like [Curcuma longa]|uniref:NAC domain-containing protein 22-like n=1 Tax=Curcuma longa TaxID=136217 RepID=UPI003D9E579D